MTETQTVVKPKRVLAFVEQTDEGLKLTAYANKSDFSSITEAAEKGIVIDRSCAIAENEKVDLDRLTVEEAAKKLDACKRELGTKKNHN